MGHRIIWNTNLHAFLLTDSLVIVKKSAQWFCANFERLEQWNLGTCLRPFQSGAPPLPPCWAGVQVTIAGCSTPTKYIFIPLSTGRNIHAPGPLFAHHPPYQKAWKHPPAPSCQTSAIKVILSCNRTNGIPEVWIHLLQVPPVPGGPCTHHLSHTLKPRLSHINL